MNNVTENVTTCGWCHTPLDNRGRGRPKKFCKASCRQRAYESRKYGMSAAWERLMEYSDCYLCEQPLDWSDRENIVTDHVIATVHGGVTEPWNLRPVHMRCNARKGSKLFIV